MFFMLDMPVDGEVAKEKVAFFSSDAELQRIKAEIAAVR